jgi:hypothetical protein
VGGADAGGQQTAFVVAGRLVTGGDEDGGGDEVMEAGCARLSRWVGDAVSAVQFTCLPGQGLVFCGATQQGIFVWEVPLLLDLLAGELT